MASPRCRQRTARSAAPGVPRQGDRPRHDDAGGLGMVGQGGRRELPDRPSADGCRRRRAAIARSGRRRHVLRPPTCTSTPSGTRRVSSPTADESVACRDAGARQARCDGHRLPSGASRRAPEDQHGRLGGARRELRPYPRRGHGWLERGDAIVSGDLADPVGRGARSNDLQRWQRSPGVGLLRPIGLGAQARCEDGHAAGHHRR